MIKAFVDQISGDTARVLIGDEGVAISLSLRSLPPGTHEGMVLRINFTIDQAATRARAGRNARRDEE